MLQSIFLSTAYLAPIQYYTKLVKYKEIWIELNENFIKQTYRNRCQIYGANGVISISIPVKKASVKTNIKDLKIDYETNWQNQHWKSIESAYRSSPFFEYYEDDIIPFYQNKYKFLIDFNMEIQNVILEQLDLKPQLKFTQEFNHEVNLDFRNKIHPKNKELDLDFKPVEYTQVFHEKYGFKSNLSIIDLLFNEGSNALELLKKC